MSNNNQPEDNLVHVPNAVMVPNHDGVGLRPRNNADRPCPPSPLPEQEEDAPGAPSRGPPRSRMDEGPSLPMAPLGNAPAPAIASGDSGSDD